ncbi:hypothetical protein HAX54_022191, partial [Datura stramonium]|nr:hypothetical protein [Datura stramonium]
YTKKCNAQHFQRTRWRDVPHCQHTGWRRTMLPARKLVRCGANIAQEEAHC